jgi:DNA-binding CsgD family transcriptional regulator
VLDAQRAMMRIVSTGHARFGIYAEAAQPAVPVLEDIRLLSRTARDAIVAGDRLDTSLLGEDLVELFRASEDWTTVVRARPDSAVGAAVGTTFAVTALVDPGSVATLLRGRLAQSSSYTAHTPQLQTLIASALGRRRRPTVFLQSAPPSGVSPAERARKVPAQLWGEWITRHAPLRVGNEVAASALAAAVVFTGTRLTHSAALALLDPHAPARQVTHVMRDLGRSSHDVDTLHAILRLTAFLDTHDVPVDYARRRALDYAGILPESVWQELCRVAAVSPGGGRRWRLARAFLYRMLSGNPLRALPAEWDAAGVTPHTLAHFAEELPPVIRALLRQVAVDFLSASGIDEPITWSPPSIETTSGDEAQLAPSLWPPSRPAWTAATEARTPEELARAYATGASTYEIAAERNVSRQTVARILADAGTQTRRGRPHTFTFDPDWLRDQYETQKQTMAQIAYLAGCSEMTINRHLHAAGITVRPRGALSIPSQ